MNSKAIRKWPLALCLLAVAGGQALGHDREVREPREIRDVRDQDRSGSDRDGSGSRERDDREQRESREGDEDRKSEDHSGSGHKGGRNESGSRHGGRSRESRNSGREPRLELERDARGAERVRGEVVVIGSRESVATIRAAGFEFIERAGLESLDAEIVRIRTPAGRSVESLAEELRRIAPDSEVAPQHVYRASGMASSAVRSPAGAAPGDASAPDSFDALLGLVDTGAAAASPVLRQSLVGTRGFTEGGYVPRDHGTAVADIAAHAGARIVSADVFGVDNDDEPVATALAVARAVDWLTASGVRVINLSLEGPDNPVLARVVRGALQRDVAIVAAVGNQGPSAPPSFPAAYPGVIAVTAIDGRGKPYRRAGRGAHIGFAARGVDITVAGIDGRQRRVSGTSFAAPMVAAVTLRLRAERGEAPVTAVIDALRAQARDLGAQGRDPVYGWGEIGAYATVRSGAR